MIRSWIIFTCLFMTVVSEVLLSPFHPQFFTDFFQVNGLQATSLFIICCRIVVIIMTPIWGLLLKKWKIEKVSVYALVSISICKWMLSESSRFSMFLAFSLLLLVFQSCLIIDLYLFKQSNAETVSYYSWMLTAQNVGLLLAPLLALILVQNGKLHIPLIGGGMVLLAAVLSFIMAQQRLKFYKPVKENKG
ncbi:hypothetical protein [Priestia flexa]|uniref:hypothetical protein n=1 Tax=Priestia flexa TaxID=86664 RepID=UPI001CD64444|nr:hypothetical protein [Priestia flexa]MCA1203144.1 hypothetical protein [Priestia flexa]